MTLMTPALHHPQLQAEEPDPWPELCLDEQSYHAARIAMALDQVITAAEMVGLRVYATIEPIEDWTPAMPRTAEDDDFNDGVDELAEPPSIPLNDLDLVGAA